MSTFQILYFEKVSCQGDCGKPPFVDPSAVRVLVHGFRVSALACAGRGVAPTGARQRAANTAGEILALTLAQQTGIALAEHKLDTSGGKSVSVITRFDRDGTRRIPFLSANSLLGLSQGEPGAYTLLADGIRQFGHDTAADLRELWRRLVFSLLASNYDDHLRNHGFLMRDPGRWALSPAYDLNPVPEIDRTQTPKTPISEEAEEPTIAAALKVASRFGLKSAAAKIILREVLDAVSGWRKTGTQLRIKATVLDAYATAFEHPLMDEARKLS